MVNTVITQSEAWQKLQDDLGERSFYERGDGYECMAIVKGTPAGNYLYLPYGPVARDAQGFQAALEWLMKLARREKALFIRLEPREPFAIKLLTSGKITISGTDYRVEKSKDLNPKETWLLDLPKVSGDPLESAKLRESLPSRLVRYYKSRNKRGLTVETSKDPEDIHYLLDLQKALAAKKGISTFSAKYLATELAQPFATLYLVKYRTPEAAKSEVVAAGLVFDYAGTRYNLQGAQSERGRMLHATGILTIQLILDAASKGQQVFDFWGIAPEGAPADHPWAGFTAFKKTFAGREVDYAGTHDIILRPLKYRWYQALRQLNRMRSK